MHFINPVLPMYSLGNNFAYKYIKSLLTTQLTPYQGHNIDYWLFVNVYCQYYVIITVGIGGEGLVSK